MRATGLMKGPVTVARTTGLRKDSECPHIINKPPDYKLKHAYCALMNVFEKVEYITKETPYYEIDGV
jgi:hypothetical protein